jgi:nucleoid-associated protein YgaU
MAETISSPAASTPAPTDTHAAPEATASAGGGGGGATTTQLTTVAPDPAPAVERTHVVRSGETFSSISMMAYGNSNYWPSIVRANPKIDPNHLKVGMTINLPALTDVKPAEPQTATAHEGPATTNGGSGATAQPAQTARVAHANAAVDPNKQYRVQPGDSLHKISVKLYGKSTLADKLYETNKELIGADPHKLKVGQVLTLPEPPQIMATNR